MKAETSGCVIKCNVLQLIIDKNYLSENKEGIERKVIHFF